MRSLHRDGVSAVISGITSRYSGWFQMFALRPSPKRTPFRGQLATFYLLITDCERSCFVVPQMERIPHGGHLW